MERRSVIKGLLAGLAGLLGAGRGKAQTQAPEIYVPRITKLSADHGRVSAMPVRRITGIASLRRHPNER